MFRRIGSAGLLVLFAAPAADAGWVTIKNETNQTIIVQECATVGGQVRKGKPVKLVPGETLREFQASAGQKCVQLLEPGLLLNKSLGQAEVKWVDGDHGFAILKVGDKVKLLSDAEVAELKTAAAATARAQAPPDTKKK